MSGLRAALMATLVAAGLARAAIAVPAPGRFVVSEDQSSVRVHVGKSGALSFAGHRHEVAAPVSGSITAVPENLGASSVELAFPTSLFRVLPEGEPEGDAPKVQEVMLGPRVLDALRFSELRFRSRAVAGHAVGSGARSYELQVTGDLTIHGVTRELVVPTAVLLDGDTLRAKGRSTIRHDQFGLEPVTAAAGTVRVGNEIVIDFEIVALRRP